MDMNKILLLLLIISSVVIFAAQKSGFFEDNAFKKIERYFSADQHVKECPYDGYTWQEVEIIVDKIVAEHVKADHIDAINHALETGEYGDCKKFLTFDTLSEREQKFLIMVCDAPLNKDDETDDLQWVQQKILCGLLEAATGSAFNILSQDAMMVRDACQQKFGLRWYPLIKARFYGINLIDEQKLDNLTPEQGSLDLFWLFFFNEASE